MRTHFFALLYLLSFTVSAQKTKTGVVVFGANPLGLAAAIQAAHSGVKTILVDQQNFDQVNLTSADKAYRIGIYADFLKRVDTLQKGKNLSNQNLTAAYTALVFKNWTDTIKNLTVIKKATIKKIQKDGKNWEIEFTNNTQIKADVVVDATAGSEVTKLAGVSVPANKSTQGVYTDKIYRTSVAITEISGVYPSGLPVSNLFAAGVDNFIVSGDNVKANILIGQAAGAAAAYCSFFKVKNTELDVRKTQGELIGYKSQLVKLDDVSVYDTLAVSIQKIIVTGILKGKLKNGKFLFLQDSTVSSDEIRLPIREYYSRSQIWFLDHKAEKLALEDVLSLIKFTGSRGNELDREVEKGWKTTLKLNGKFDLKRLVTRREFARLLDIYLKPFERSIDLTGNLKS